MNPSRPFTRLYVYNGFITLAGVTALCLVHSCYPPPPPGALVAFVLLGVVTNLSLVPTSSAVVISLSDAVFMATSIVLGPPAAAAVIAASVLAGEVGTPRPAPSRFYRLSRFVGNCGMYTVMVSAAAWVYARLGGLTPIENLSVASYLAVLAFILVYQALNRLVLYPSLVLRGQSLRAALASERESLPVEILDLHIGILIALAYVHTGLAPLVIFGVVIFLISLLLRRRVSMAEQLQRQVTQLAVLNEISRALSATLDIPHLMQKIYQECSRLIDTSNFYIALCSPDRKDEVTFVLETVDGRLDTTPETRRGGRGLTEYVINNRKPLLLPDEVETRTRALGIDVMGRRAAQCWLGVPMIAGDRVVGMLAAQSYTTPRVFTQEHLNILMTIAAQAAIAIENARLLEAVAHQERLRREFELARQIQKNLLPAPPQIAGLFIAACCQPAHEAGGDLFDFIQIDEHHLGIAIGDVAGKGMPAALLMATAQSLVRACAHYQLDPARVLEAVNEIMYKDTRGKTYVSLCYMVLDTHTWSFEFASAGHLSPLLCGQNVEPIYLFTSSSLPVGVQPSLKCSSHTHTLQPRQAILLYTDGVVEAHNPHHQMLSFDGLRTMAAHQPGERLMQTVLDGVMRFADSQALQDDLTLVVLERL